MQFTILSALTTLALAAFAVAAPTSNSPSNQCNNGAIQCCNSTTMASDPVTALLLGLLGVTAGGITGQVGLTCSPLSVIGVAGNSCSQQSVCCENNSFNGVVALGCTPINLNL